MSAPLTRVLESPVPGVTLAADDDTVLGQSDLDATVTSVAYVPEAAITGAATNNRAVSLINKGQDGAGTAVVAALTFGASVNAAADNEVAVTLSGTPANLLVLAGDTLVWHSTHNGTGIADPGGVARVTLARRDV